MTAAASVCADIGGSFIRVARVEGTHVTRLGHLPTPARDWTAFTATLAVLLAGEAPGLPLGLSVAGVADGAGGVLSANIPCLAGRRVAAELSAVLDRPVALANDADCFTLAEAVTGAGAGHRVVLGIILGSGVGGGLVVDGRIVPGAGEWGHGPVLRHGPLADLPCPCGQRGCLDGAGSARGLERLHGVLHGREHGAATDSRAIVAGWLAGEPACGATVRAWAELLAGPLAFALNVTAATIVPAGGGLGAVPALMAELDAAVRARCLPRADGPRGDGPRGGRATRRRATPRGAAGGAGKAWRRRRTDRRVRAGAHRAPVRRVLLEVCVDTPANLHAAVAAGAGRIELCAALEGGGLTPSAGFMRLAAGAGVPVHALIRPRGGGFGYTAAELDVMAADIAAARGAGLAGIAVGASRADGTLDTDALRRLLRAAEGLSLTLHRAFDLAPDKAAALEDAVALGFARVLTSGGARSAPEGAAMLAALVRQARGRVVVLPGAGITPANAPALLAATGAAELHASCRSPAPASAPGLHALGFTPDRPVDPGAVRALSMLAARS